MKDGPVLSFSLTRSFVEYSWSCIVVFFNQIFRWIFLVLYFLFVCCWSSLLFSALPFHFHLFTVSSFLFLSFLLYFSSYPSFHLFFLYVALHFFFLSSIICIFIFVFFFCVVFLFLSFCFCVSFVPFISSGHLVPVAIVLWSFFLMRLSSSLFLLPLFFYLLLLSPSSVFVLFSLPLCSFFIFCLVFVCLFHSLKSFVISFCAPCFL